MNDEYKVKKFIKLHLDIIDQQDYEELYLLAYNQLSWSECSTLSDMLATAEIDYVTHRDNAIIHIMTDIVKTWCESNTAISAMPLDMFIDAFFENILGMRNAQVRDILFAYRDMWSDDVTIHMVSQTLVIEKVHKK